MQINGNTVLITGGGSGIGRALAEAFEKSGNEVVIAGRREDVLKQASEANPGMKYAVLDIESEGGIRSFAEQITKDYPKLNVVIHNAGIMRPEEIKQSKLADAEATITTNLLGPIRLTAALLPTLLRQSQAAIVTVSSGLAFVPMTPTPTYCATKAAIHSYTQSLRSQLKGTPIQVIELIPPYVQTELMGAHQANDPMAMPLNDFITEVMSIWKDNPNVSEICVERVKPLRFAERSGKYDEVFRQVNEAAAAVGR